MKRFSLREVSSDVENVLYKTINSSGIYVLHYIDEQYSQLHPWMSLLKLRAVYDLSGALT